MPGHAHYRADRRVELGIDGHLLPGHQSAGARAPRRQPFREQCDLVDRLQLRAPRIVEPNGVDLEEFDRMPPRGSFRDRHSGLGNRPMVEALLSRLRHYCHTVVIDGPTLREPQG